MVYLNYIKYGIIAIILIAAALMPYFYKQWRDALDRVEQVANYATNKDSETQYFKNELGKQVAINKSIELDRKAFNAIGDDYKSLQQEFIGIKKSLKNVESITKLNVGIKDTLLLHNIDTIIHNQAAKFFEYQDEWSYINGVVIGDTTLLNHTEEVPLTVVVTWSRRRVLGLKIGRKDWQVQATSPNENASISGLENITIRKR